MSQKWIRSKQWDNEHLTGAWLPVKVVLRAFSSIPLAVFLLGCLAMYGTLASVPIGMIAQIPTYLLVIMLAFISVGAFSAGPMWVLVRLTRRLRADIRFVLLLVPAGLLVTLGFWGWAMWVWPSLRFDASTGRGFMLFSDFVTANRAVTLRRLPGMEMSEIEFYAWWPLRVILLLFVTNMVTATVRRIEFIFPNLGVLTVHTGIVTITLGSLYYAGRKQEGDMLLQSGAMDAVGHVAPGPIQNSFYDRIRPVLWVGSGGRMEQRPLPGLPRYNDYALNVLGFGDAGDKEFASDRGRTLSIPVPRRAMEMQDPSAAPAVGDDVRFEVVGFASYARMTKEWQGADAASTAGSLAREVRLVPVGAPGMQAESLHLIPDEPAMRWTSIGGQLAIEHTRNMSEERWSDLSAEVPAGAAHALVVEIPSAGFKKVFAVQAGARLEAGGYVLEVTQVAAHPPMSLVTRGYEEADSSVAIVRVTPPSGVTPFSRWLYHRFPEITQDLLDETAESGMPRRTAPSAAIRIAYLDCSMIQVYIDERPAAGGDGADPPVRAIVRLGALGAAVAGGGGSPKVHEGLHTGGTIPLLPAMNLALGSRSRAVQVEVPRIVPESQRQKDAIGTHAASAIAVRVSTEGPWSNTFWIPFTEFPETEASPWHEVKMPDGRLIQVMFGRERHTLPGLALQLTDFEMIPYPSSDTPRDYRSDLTVYRQWRNEQDTVAHPTSLNNPLKISPFIWSESRAWVRNALDWVLIRFSPMQYKFSQSGWDASGWNKSKRLADQGSAPRAYARYTILGVGNNPGIYVIAAGALMMCVGIPWAFYLKPVIVRMKKRRIQRQLEAGALLGKNTRANGSAHAPDLARAGIEQ